MTAAPKKKPRSAAQVRAGKAYAAAGRAKQKSNRLAYEKAHHGAKPPRTKKEAAASKRWAAAGRSAQAARRAGKTPVTAKKAALPAVVSSRSEPVLWLPGCGDELPVCAVTAVANNLLAASGVMAPDASMLALHQLAGGDGGATLAIVLEAASVHGLAGMRLCAFNPCEPGVAVPGLVYGIQTRRGYHAVLACPYGMVSWGLVMAWSGERKEAWWLEWEAMT